MKTLDSVDKDYVSLNARLNLYGKNGEIQFEADKQAARSFFLYHVNENMRFFNDRRERIEFLVENGYYESEFISKYSWEFIDALHQKAYDKKVRFETFFGAYKFYKSYALKERTGSKRYLERYEDRVVATALYLGSGDEQLATDIMEEMISFRLQPATPTFQNSGRMGGGELVSCFLLNVGDSLQEIMRGSHNSAYLSKAGGGVAFCMTDIRAVGDTLSGIEGLAKGIKPWAKIYEDVFSGFDQLGQRPGAGALYLNVHHPDILAILDSKRSNAAEKDRLQTLSLGVVVPDITMQLAEEDGDLYTFSPYDIKKVYGVPFSQISVTEHYDEIMANPNIRKIKRGKVRDLFTRIAEIQFESGYPYIMYEDAVNEANPIKGKVSMSNLCQTGDVRINTTLGYKRLDDLYMSQEEFDVVVDTRARDMDLEHLGTSVERSTKVFKTATNAEVYKMTTAEGFQIRGTAWHKMYVDRDGEIVKVPLADIVLGDKVLVQSGKGSHGTVHNPDLAYLAGVVAADGSISERTANHSIVNLSIYGDKREFTKKIEESINRVVLDTPEVEAGKASSSPKFKHLEDEDLSRLYSAALAKLLAHYGITADTKNSVPEFVFQGDRETREAFLSGLFQMDGSVWRPNNSNHWQFSITSTGNKFLRDVQMLLLDFGVYSRIHTLHDTPDVAMLTDGKGGLKPWNRSAAWLLKVTDIHSRSNLNEFIDWKSSHRSVIKDAESRVKRVVNARHGFTATVISVDFDGTEDVYDVTVDNGHSVIFNGVATGQCSEITQVSTPSVIREDGSYEVVGQDISCNLASLNIAKVMESPNFGKTVETSIRALTAVSRLTDLTAVPTIKAGNDAGHSIGLGQMNLHGFFGSVGIHYENPEDPSLGASAEAVDFTSAYFAAVAYHAINTSNMLAVEFGESFEDFEESKYATGEYFEKYVTRDWLPTTDKVKAIFYDSGIHLPTREDWAALRSRVMKTGMYNRYLQAVPPTGSISYINNSTSSIHPITAQVEIREEGQVGRRYYPAYGLTNENREFYKDAYEIGPYAVIDIYAAAQEHIDQALSLTLFFTDEHTTADINMAQRYAWANGVKTIYYIRVKTNAIDGTESSECVSCSL